MVRGEELFVAGDFQGAVAVWGAAQSLREDDSELLQRLIGDAYREMGDYEQAADHYTRAVVAQDTALGRVSRAEMCSLLSLCSLAVGLYRRRRLVPGGGFPACAGDENAVAASHRLAKGDPRICGSLDR